MSDDENEYNSDNESFGGSDNEGIIISNKNPLFKPSINIKSIGETKYDSEDESAPVRAPVRAPAPVPAPVQPKTWGKLPVRVEPNRVEPNRVEPVREQKPLQKPNGIRTLMVKNLPRDTTPEKLTNELRSIFKAYGPIKDVYIPINRDGTYAGTIKGFAKVQFQNADHTAIAVSQSITIRKNKLGIEYAKEDR